MEKGMASKDSVALNNILFYSTKHRSNFIGDKKECTFANVNATTWVADVQYQIPFLILTWMRQLQESFFEDETVRWNALGRYAPTTKLMSDEKKNPLTAIYFTTDSGSDIKNIKGVRITKFRDILPQEPKGNRKQILCRSLEEWAMLLFAPAVPEKLQNAMSEDYETKQRFEQMKTKTVDHKYVWTITNKDYSRYGGQQANDCRNEDIETTVDYKNKEPEELQYALVKSLINMNEYANKVIKKKDPQNSTYSYINLPTEQYQLIWHWSTKTNWE